jgi:Putative porin
VSFGFTQQRVWNNDFKKTLETNLEAALNIERFQVEVGAAYHLINNLIYFDTTGYARQSGKPVSILQFFVKKNFVLWRIHLDNQVILQKSSEDIVRLPQYFGKHSLYFEGKMFKVLNARIGLDVRYQAAYRADYYMPLIGQFQLQDKRMVDFYPAADVFAAFQVTKFRAFFKLENITRFIYPQNQLFYQTSYYPMPPSSGFRLGIRWLFLD